MTELIFVFELIGTVAFAISGAMVALNCKMDLLGVLVLGVLTATGGGITRDIVLGQCPPQAFVDATYVLLAAITSLIVFAFAYSGMKPKNEKNKEKWTFILMLLDSLGLAVFTVMGVNTAWGLFEEGNMFLCIFSGVVTGVGGGLLRDLIANSVPYIFSKHIYAIASMIGATVCCYLLKADLPIVAIWSGAAVIVIIRILAAHYRWSLPKAPQYRSTSE